LEEVTGGKAQELIQTLVAAAAQRAADPSVPLPARLAALESLRMARWEEHRERLVGLLDPQNPLELQTAALGAMAALDHPGVAEAVLARMPQMGPAVKGQATDLLLSRPAWALALLEAIEQGRLPASELDPARLKLLAGHREAAIRQRAARLLQSSQVGRRSDVVEAYRPVLAMQGDPRRGREVFTKTCASCHRLQGVGHEIGPNLAAMKARGAEAILLNVLDPNREVNPQYLTYAVLTTDGRQLTGILAAETATSITLKRADNASDTVLRIDIEQLRSTGMSLMPEGLEKQIDQAAMADLIAYLMTAE
jgi:putative heme-binding domain-containing protein